MTIQSKTISVFDPVSGTKMRNRLTILTVTFHTPVYGKKINDELKGRGKYDDDDVLLIYRGRIDLGFAVYGV